MVVLYMHTGMVQVKQKKKIKNETKATIRCIPLESDFEEGECIYSQKKSKQKVLFAKAY